MFRELSLRKDSNTTIWAIKSMSEDYIDISLKILPVFRFAPPNSMRDTFLRDWESGDPK